MLTSDFDYNLPKQLIAQIPLEPRDSSRLMVIGKKTKNIEHKHFSDIIDYLKKGDLLVWNNTKVFKARLRGSLMLDESVVNISKKIDSTDKILNTSPVEIFLVKPMENNKVWKVLAKPGRKLRLGMKIVFAQDFSAKVMLKENDGTYLIQFDEDDMLVRAKANKYGEVPTPPYIASEELGMKNKELSERYQTVYAKEEGSVAAPTAGFHFTPELIEKLKTKGIEFAEVTLHVGLGTFLPVKTDKIEEHKMHDEWVELTAKNADLINQAKAGGRRVVAVGTTTVRVLEGVAQLFCHSDRPARGGEWRNPLNTDSRIAKDKGSLDYARDDNRLRPYSGDINIFIYPGFQFKVIDALITNFHLPKSTLLMLVSAFAGDKDFMLECYQKAVDARYRFFSFGDAMLIK
ncbi:MAG: tRNA preQ1(34) S-adenosylmethionine ribosyltransferase-isomerase QueA [Candidatus Magasanikbacteria bacterium]|nr:tRNA preQ1(34) S-adenosylmethionine ribosyltransferase-isomerase QueA [Candidatus Magasanikbacteria bacterium]